MPAARASFTPVASTPLRKSIQAELSTTTATATQFVDVDLQMHFALQRQDALHRSTPSNLFEPFHERFGDSLSSGLLRGIEQISRQVGRNAAGIHIDMMIFVLTIVNTPRFLTTSSRFEGAPRERA